MGFLEVPVIHSKDRICAETADLCDDLIPRIGSELSQVSPRIVSRLLVRVRS